jgi:hypothetical protein
MMVHSYDPRDIEATEALANDLAALHRRSVPIEDMREALATAHHMALRELELHLLDTEAMPSGSGKDPAAVAIELLQRLGRLQARVDARTKLMDL